MMEKINSAIKKLLNPIIGDIIIVQAHWGSIVEHSTHSFPYKIVKNTLFIAVDHPLWQQEIQGKSKIIRDRIKKLTGIEIKKIKIDLNPAFFRENLHRKFHKEKLREAISPEELISILATLDGEFINQRLKLLHKKLNKQEEK